MHIPAAVMEAARLRFGQPVSVGEEHGRVIIEALGPEYDLATLVAGITDENRHDEINMRPPVGREFW